MSDGCGRKGRCGKVVGKVILIALVLAGFWRTDASTTPSRLPSAEEINSILKELSDITGFRVRKQLPFALITRDEVNKYIKEQIKESVKPDEIKAEETTLKKFGFAPADFDLKQTTIDLLTEQAAAFYDFKRKKLFISDWATVNMRDSALIHELAHALADQNFPIHRYLGRVSDDGEASLARQAVVEGQASWLMLEVEARRAGRTLADAGTARQYLSNESDSADDEFPVFSRAPLYLRKTLTFPYTAGDHFQQAVFLRDGKPAFAQIFRKPPVSSAQILHPELYFDNVVFTDPTLPKPVRNTKPFVTGELGELETRILLEQYVGSEVADDLGPKLMGSGYRIDETKQTHRMTLIYQSEWKDTDAAIEYFGAYKEVMRKKWKALDATTQTADRYAGKSEDGYFAVTRIGKRVLAEEGFAHPI